MKWVEEGVSRDLTGVAGGVSSGGDLGWFFLACEVLGCGLGGSGGDWSTGSVGDWVLSFVRADVRRCFGGGSSTSGAGSSPPTAVGVSSASFRLREVTCCLGGILGNRE